MARIQIMNQTTKTSGKIKLRFRLKDGRGVQLYHKSEIEATIEELAKFEYDGTPKKRANYNRKLAKAIQERMDLIGSIYSDALTRGIKLTSEMLEQEIDRFLYPDKYREESNHSQLLLDRFKKYIDDGSFSEARKAGYRVTYGILSRYLKIIGKEQMGFDEVNPDFIVAFRDFVINEYRYASKKKYQHLYADIKNTYNIPSAPRARNTIVNKLSQLKAFFTVLEDADEIGKSPFRKLGRENKRNFLTEQYVSPVALTFEEVKKILNKEVPENLQATKEAFLLQCALGCRISDFKAMNMGNVAVTSDGVPYVRYVAQKTKHALKTITETKTPLVRFALDIIKKNNFNMPILNYVSGAKGFNKKIKQLLKICGIDREVDVMGENETLCHKPLWETASTKLGRKTNVTLLSRVQINTTIGGLHTNGSEAVKHYYDQTMADLFLLMSRAFGEEPYRVNKNLDIIESPVASH